MKATVHGIVSALVPDVRERCGFAVCFSINHSCHILSDASNTFRKSVIEALYGVPNYLVRGEVTRSEIDLL